jgi:subtilisin family serine protease
LALPPFIICFLELEMRRALAIASLAFLAACQDVSDTTAPPPEAQLSVLPPTAAQQARESIMAGEVIVRVREGEDVDAVAAAHGVSVSERGYRNAFAVLRGAVGNESALAARLGADARVEYAEPNYLRQPDAINPKLWAFQNVGGLTVSFTKGAGRGQPVSSLVSVADADEDNVEGYASVGSDVVIGSIDTGVQMNHAEFAAGQLIAGRDWYSNDNNPADENDHGTHTTGTMAGQTVGIAGVSGAGAHVKVLVQRVCGSRGCPSAAIANAIYAAADYPGMVAMNLSLGGASSSNAEKAAVEYAVGKGVLVIASAGNDGTTTVGCPACLPGAISVAATNWPDGLAYYSNRGTGLDLSAPGGELYSNTTSEAGIWSSVRAGYAYFQGTSMAAPQVTGTAGIVASVTGLRGAALRARLESTADDRGAAGYDTTFGNGRLNSYRAVTGNTLGGNN